MRPKNGRDHQTKRRKVGLLVKLLAVARWNKCGLIRKESCIAWPLRQRPQRSLVKSSALYKRSSGQGCSRSMNKRKTASNRRWCHFLCPATNHQDARLSESDAPDCHAATGCPYTAAPIRPANTQQKCKSEFASTDSLKL